MKICQKCVVKGRVQGVFFRQGTYEEAIKRGLTGWVHNVDSGEVECLICGEEDAVHDMLKWLNQGPRAAKVIELKNDDHPWEDHHGFEIRR